MYKKQTDYDIYQKKRYKWSKNNIFFFAVGAWGFWEHSIAVYNHVTRGCILLISHVNNSKASSSSYNFCSSNSNRIQFVSFSLIDSNPEKTAWYIFARINMVDYLSFQNFQRAQSISKILFYWYWFLIFILYEIPH